MAASRGNDTNKNQDQQTAQQAGGRASATYFSSHRASASLSSSEVSKAIELAKAFIDQDTTGALRQLAVLPFVGSNVGMDLSGIIFHMVKGNTVLYHFAAVPTACNLGLRTVDVGNNNKVDIQKTIGDLATNAFFDAVDQQLISVYDREGIAGELTGSMDSNISVLWNLDQITKHVVLANDACLDVAAQNGVIHEGTFLATTLQGTNATATVEYNAGTVENSESMPTRSDISVLVSNKMPYIEGGDPTTRNLVRTDAFIGLNYVEPQPQMVNGQMIPMTQQYRPEVIISNIQALGGPASLEVLLYGIYSATSFAYQNNWLSCFKPNSYTAARAKDAINLRDIGALNRLFPHPEDSPLRGKAIETGTDAFAREGLYQLANTFFLPDLAVAMDINETGTNSWIQNILLNLVSNDHQMRAMCQQAIVAAANALTDGEFGKLYNNEPVLIEQLTSTVHLGTYESRYGDANGEKRDIRDLDVLAILNIQGDNDIDNETALKYETTFDNLNEAEALRLNKRWDIIAKLLPNAKLTGRAKRVRFNPAWINTLAQAIANCNTGIVIAGTSDVIGQPQRGNQGYYDTGINSAQVSGGFATPGSQQMVGGVMGVNARTFRC